jgi:thioredoxin 1
MDKAGAPVIELTGEDLHAAIKAHSRLVVDCWAPWCPDCRMIAPVFDALAADNKGKITFAKVNLDHNQEVKDKYQVLAVPTLLVFKDGNLVNRMVEPAPRKQPIQQELDKGLG